jgi:sRNA-binding carbon storage regulator CsrA
MLVLQRSPGEQIRIGDGIILTLKHVYKNRKQCEVTVHYSDTGEDKDFLLNLHKLTPIALLIDICLTKSSTLTSWIGIKAPMEVTILRGEVTPR